MLRSATLLALGMWAASAAPSAAQLPQPGTHAVSFAVPNGGGAAFGYRTVRSAHASIGWNVAMDARWVSPSGSRAWDLRVGPDVRLYRGSEGPVRPFLYGATQLGYGTARTDQWGLTLDGSVGLGAEWFAARSMSISGETGLTAVWAHNHDPAGNRDTGDIETFTSSVSLNLYF